MVRSNAILGAAALVTLGASVVSAQMVIADPAVILRNAVIAEVKQEVLDTLALQVDRIQHMAKRLSAITNLQRYAISDDDTPKWRIHLFQGEQFLYANPYNAAMNYGDGMGMAFEQVARRRADAGAPLGTFGEETTDADATLRSQLATLDAADSSIIAGTDQTGQLRFNGRKELAAIEALETDTLDPSPSQSATAILDKISGASLIRARQQQARMQFLAALVEQLIVDNKRSRDTEAASMNMQLERLRWGTAVNTSVVAGAADALRSWRQP